MLVTSGLETVKGAQPSPESCAPPDFIFGGNMPIRKPLEERFWPKVDKRGLDDCWEWTGCRVTYGYGQIRQGRRCGRKLLSHRVSWELHNSTIPTGMYVCHSCDNPPCVNPRHLFLGTNKDNQEDARRKGRRIFGERSPHAKLTDRKVIRMRRIRKTGLSQEKIAAMFSISLSQTQKILKGEKWKHVPMIA